jgi:hypothetical protein
MEVVSAGRVSDSLPIASQKPEAAVDSSIKESRTMRRGKLGFLDDFRKGMKKVQQVQDQVRKATDQQTPGSAGIEFTVESSVTRPGRATRFDWATPNEYDPIPPLKLRSWGAFDGSEPGRGGYGFEWPDGRLLHPDRLGVRAWKKVGVFVGHLSGGKFHLEDLNDSSFAPGQPIQLVAEPENPHSEKGSAIAIRNWSGDRKAGYVPSEFTEYVRKFAADEDVRAIVLSCRYHEEGGKVIRTFLDWAMFRPGRIEGVGQLPPLPPIAPPRVSKDG